MIHNFVYIDSEKLRSMSSQLFEGVTEYILKKNSENEETGDSQKGPIGSGQILGDIFRRGSSSTELKFLEDHAYVLFEKRLMEDGLIDVINGHTGPLSSPTKPFVSVTGQMTLHDVKEVLRLVSNFNEFGEALYRISNQNDIETGSKGKPLNDNEVRFRAKQLGMQIDKKFADAVAVTLRWGYQDLIEAQMLVGETLFTAPLKRASLREAEDMLVQKFSRRSQLDFTMLGMVTRRGTDAVASAPPEPRDAESVKEGLQIVLDHMLELESMFTGPRSNEVVVDPVAIYMSV